MITMNNSQYSKEDEQRFIQEIRTSQQTCDKVNHCGNIIRGNSEMITVNANDVRYRYLAVEHTQQYGNTVIDKLKLSENNLNALASCSTTNPTFLSAQHTSSSLMSNAPISTVPPCYTNTPRKKVDASTMTDRDLQNDSYISATQQEYSDKVAVTSGTTYTVQAIVPASGWQSLAGPPGSTVAEYLSRLPASTLPLTLHHFLKFSNVSENNTPETKKDDVTGKKKRKRKYKKKPYIPRPPRPKPGEIRLTTALDGSTLYCCPECHMAYPERSLLEQHLVLHKLERRFVCDICGAGLKRKEHLDRHKQGHSPDRPFVCTVCLKAFKRNEHLSRHFIIHSGEKTQVCMECGKAFYRKDHLRKHSQSHIAKRLRAEVMGQKSETDHRPIVSLDSVMAVGHNGMQQSHGVVTMSALAAGTAVPVLSS